MTLLRTLLLQSDLRWNDPSANRDRLQEMIAGYDGAFDLAVLPETFTTGFLGDSGSAGEDMTGPTVSWMCELAARHGAALAGSLVIREAGQQFNRFVFVTPDGVLGHYDKRHLFSYGGEDGHYTAGRERVILGFRGWRINLQVCYDLRFPAWCRNRGDYDLMLLVANWPQRRIHHWNALLEARAIENQSWVVGLNRAGKDGNGLLYPGCSVVHGPMGETVVKLGEEEQCKLAELDLGAVTSARNKFPFLSDADSFHFL